MNHDAAAFFRTLTPEILSPADYVDWEAVRTKVKRLRREIALVQSLDTENAAPDLAELLREHPTVLKVLQLLIAHTPDFIAFSDPAKFIDFRADLQHIATDPARAKAVAAIFVEMGLPRFLQEVRSVEDVVKGVLIGLEPNGRKNRRGITLEEEVEGLIASTAGKVARSTGRRLSVRRQMFVDLPSEKKRIDYVILDGEAPFIALEVNFYATSGSKPSEVLGRAYPELQANLGRQGMALIVLTDGRGWERMKPVIATAFAKLAWLMNLKQARSGALEQAIRSILAHPAAGKGLTTPEYPLSPK